MTALGHPGPEGCQVSSSSARKPSSPGSAATPRSASARPTWPVTGGPPTEPTSPTCSPRSPPGSASLVPQPLQRLRTIVDRRIPASHENTLDGSRDNISAHYDLSNDLFAAFLDPTMSYSAAWFDLDELVESVVTGSATLPSSRIGRPVGERAASQDRRSPGLRGGRAGDSGCWRSAPDGERSPSGPRSAAPTSPR